jgi:hypothetical protein
MTRHWYAMAAASAALLFAPLAHAADTTEVSGVKYDNTLQLANAKLVLNGAGTRYKAIFKVYTAGLYLQAKAATPEAVYAASGPRRMHIVMLRDIDGNELGKLFTRGMQDNATREEFGKSIPGTIRMGEIFAQRKKLNAGDYFTVDWIPGTGTQISVDGKPVGEPIKEPEFYTSLMKIWLGKSPADAHLKDALLGKAPGSSGGAAER